MADDSSIDLMGGGFTRGMLADLEQKMLLDVFSKHIDAVLHRINDGKEATVYLCRGTEVVQGRALAAKVYRDRRFRGFANNSEYLDANRIGDRRLAKAVRQRSRVGKRAAQRIWVNREWQALQMLHGEGVSVPQPIDHTAEAVLMEFIGDEGGAAPVLAHVRMDREEAGRLWQQLLREVEILLDCGLVHGDLSAYNVLYHQGRLRIIDLPQVVQLDDAVDVWTLFARDLENISAYFSRQGLTLDPLGEAIRLWSIYGT